MTHQDHHPRGAAPVGLLDRMDPWEARLVANLRLWCEGPRMQARVRRDYDVLCAGRGAEEYEAFDRLIATLIGASYRPLARHSVGCTCLGADEAIFANFVRTASEGHLTDAALIATLITGPARAEYIALLAGQVGETLRRGCAGRHPATPARAENGLRLH